MHPESNPVPESHKPEAPSPADEQLTRSLRAQQRRLGWLTAAAVGFWTLAILASVGVLICFAVFYAPKEKQILHDYQTFGHLGDPSQVPQAAGPTIDAVRRETDRALGVHFTMNWAMTRGILAVAMSVIVLSCGTLATLLLVVMSRRVTLRQINANLARISEQLRQLQARGG